MSGNVTAVLNSALRYKEFTACLREWFNLTEGRLTELWNAAENSWGALSAAALYAKAFLPLKMCAENISINDRDWRRVKRDVLGLKEIILKDIIIKSRYTRTRRNLVKAKLRDLEKGLASAGYIPFSLHFRLDSRAMVGEPPPPFKALFEGGTLIDPIIEVPYIPGSSLKGLLRMVYNKIGEKLPGCLGELGEPALFGSLEKGIGAMVLTDAYPDPDTAVEFLLDGDATVPMYADGTSTPRIEEHRANSVPSKYPVVRRGVGFVEILGIKRGLEDICGDELHALMRGFFELSTLLGVGRKTSLGYGKVVVIG
ncbi:MAG: type III-B CRISPR module RAMP protein Cmr6 [Desulfurococcales archaeon]|nr:type III-B CRISPR module RAMP protein Cmr6 [Desulfurococcales archaeon]